MRLESLAVACYIFAVTAITMGEVLMFKISAWPAYWIAVLWLLATAVPAFPQAGENPLGLKPDHITASVMDVDRAARWYQDALGFKLVSSGTHEGGAKFAELQIPGFGIGLVQSNQAAITAPAGAVVSPSWIHIVFSVADPDRTFKLLQQRGVNVSTRSGIVTSPVTTFLIHDSEGNEIEIVRARPS